MLWNKKTIIIGIGILCSVFVSVLSSCASYAIADYSVTLDWDNFTSVYLCGGNSDRNCSDYSYFISVPSGSCIDNAPSFYVYNFNGNYINSLVSVCSTVIIPFSSTPSIQVTGGRYLPDRYSGNITITLSDHYGSAPSGSVTLTENGSFDVSSYATAVVDVPPEVVYGDYHDDLVSINNSILICAAVCLVIYFFYCIYRMIIKGVK